MVRILWLCTLAAACGGSAPPPPATHAHFRAIARQEARIDEAQRDGLEGDGCERRCAARAQACDASRRICEIATSVSDADATARCQQSAERCRQLSDATEACGCPQ